jgi:hypothetical protein
VKTPNAEFHCPHRPNNVNTADRQTCASCSASAFRIEQPLRDSHTRISNLRGLITAASNTHTGKAVLLSQATQPSTQSPCLRASPPTQLLEPAWMCASRARSPMTRQLEISCTQSVYKMVPFQRAPLMGCLSGFPTGHGSFCRVCPAVTFMGTPCQLRRSHWGVGSGMLSA